MNELMITRLREIADAPEVGEEVRASAERLTRYRRHRPLQGLRGLPGAAEGARVGQPYIPAIGADVMWAE